MTRITISDVQEAGHCATGIYRWFLDHGFTKAEFAAFLKDGIDSDELLSRGDFLAERVVRMAERRKGILSSRAVSGTAPDGGCPTKTCPGSWT